MSSDPFAAYRVQKGQKSKSTDNQMNDPFSAYRVKNKKEENKSPERSKLEKLGRVGTQYGLGRLENILLPYEAAVAPLSSKDAQNAAYRETLGEDLERLLEQKASGVWDKQDQDLYNHLVEQLQNPEKSGEFVQTADIGVRSLAEKATGLNLQPEGILEKAASWSGFIKNPKNIAKIGKLGLNSKDVIKSIAPTGTEALRGLGAGTALQLAEEGEFGPIGTLAAAVVGDIAGGGIAGLAKGTLGALRNPKEFLAKKAAKLTPKDKLALQKDLIEDFRKSGLTADVGTLTDSDLIKFMQSKLAQSGLTGRALDDLKQQMTSEIKNEYEALAKSLGEAKYTNAHEAGTIAKEGLTKIRDLDLAATRQLYSNANKSLKSNSYVDTNRLASVIENIEKDLTPGAIKSSEQRAVLDAVDTLKRDLYDSAGNLMFGNVKELMNNKIALNDIINYEVQGGAKQLLKGIVKELDRTIISHGKDNPSFAKNYINANKKFSEHAKTFRNKNVSQLLNAQDPAQVMNKMNTVQGIRDLKKVMTRTSEGKEIFDGLSRLKLDKVIGDNLVDSTSQQVKLGTFSKLLEKGKNKEIIQEILGPQAFKRLERLQKNSGRLADTAQKFFNASKSGVTITDVGIVGKALNDMAHLLAGNPWPLAKTGVGILGARYLTNLMANPEFLKLVEEAILVSGKDDIPKLLNIGEKLIQPIQAAIVQSQDLNKGSQAQSEKNT
jgi:hypothetical protein